ncbi:MAG: 3-deoxy-manno-octulosonate cytidylyltransferase [Chlamydiales bacterium]|nr:3-deoxy-manno-octulosonate cytidylyltransferase [Chlamydiales bacterium]
MTEHQVVGVIPARWQSSRFPGKPLANILGKSLIKRTYENALKSSRLNTLVVATDDRRIYDHVLEFGGKACMTSEECATGTDRVNEAIQAHFPEASIIVNIQGDEPCLDPLVIDTLVEKLEQTPNAVVTTPIAKITDPQDIFSPTAVKCVFDGFGRALYFSRAPIPFPQNVKKIHDYYRHLGIYCFRQPFLKQYAEMERSRLQEIEDLEQLKILEAGYPIYISFVEDQGIGIDTPEDLKRVEEVLCANISS